MKSYLSLTTLIVSIKICTFQIVQHCFKRSIQGKQSSIKIERATTAATQEPIEYERKICCSICQLIVILWNINKYIAIIYSSNNAKYNLEFIHQYIKYMKRTLREESFHIRAAKKVCVVLNFIYTCVRFGRFQYSLLLLPFFHFAFSSNWLHTKHWYFGLMLNSSQPNINDDIQRNAAKIPKILPFRMIILEYIWDKDWKQETEKGVNMVAS